MGKIFGMFDKLDDIVYEPIKFVCDAVRMPMKNHDIKKQQEFDKNLKKFEEELELDRERKKMEMSVDERRMNEEINQMILDNQLKYNERLSRIELDYRKEMANAAAQLVAVISNIQADSRERLLQMYNEQLKNYSDLQADVENRAIERIEKMKKIFPDGSANDKIVDLCFKLLEDISDNSKEFAKSINEDMKNAFGIINVIVKETTALSQKYFLPNAPVQAEIVQNEVKAIEQKD